MSDIEQPLWDGPEPDEKAKHDAAAKVDLGDALAFVAKEAGWIGKLLTLLLLGVMSTIGTTGPLLIGVLPLLPPDLIAELARDIPYFQGRTFAYTPAYGLLLVALVVGVAAGAAQLGYYIDVVRRVRADAEVKLPPWDDAGQLLADGGKMMIAYFTYILTTLGVLVVTLTVFGVLTAFVGALAGLLVFVCVLLPLVLAYALLVIFLTSICVVPYSETGRLRDFFRVGWAWGQVREHGKLTLTWFALGVAANMGFQAVQSIPVVGVLGIFLALAMQAPVQGHLLGQYAAALDGLGGRKRKGFAGEG